MSEAHARLTELFLQAVELGEPERAALLARLRSEDVALATRLSAMLAADSDADSALHTAGLAAALTHERAGAVDIPGFRVESVLGEGGMGTVYAGEQESPRRPVAIKVLHARSSAAQARFAAEAEVMARLDHPGIARVIAVGEAEGHPYLVMERVEGATLEVHLRRARPKLFERLELFTAICDAIHHAHVKGVIHRDVKPSNVMVRGDGRVAVLDFGVARIAPEMGPTAGTAAGELIGTPLYMSPEQARLRPDEVDARSDVYSLGVLFYELCCNALPYDARGAPLSEIANLICNTAPRPLGQRSPELRGNLEAVAAKALAKAPADRYQSASAFADDVRRHLAGQAVLARTPGALEQLWRLARRRPAAAGAIAGGALALIAFACVLTVLWVEARAARRAAEVARAQLEARNNDLLVRQARADVVRDPTAAIRWLSQLTDTGVDLRAAWAIADEARGRGVATLVRAHDGELRWLESVGDGEAFVTGGIDGRVRYWPAIGAAPRELAALSDPVHVVRAGAGGRVFAIGAERGLLRVVDADGRLLSAPAGHSGTIKRLVWSRSGALVSGDTNGGVWLWPGGAAPGRRLADAGADIASVAIAEDGRGVVAGSSKGDLWWWEVAAERRVDLGAQRASVIAAWTGGVEVAVALADGRVRRWRRAGEAPSTVELGRTCRHAVFTPDGQAAVLSGDDGSVWRVAGATVEPLSEREGRVEVEVSRDGRRIAAADRAGQIQVWDRATGRALRLRGHGDRVRRMAFTSNGRVLFSGDENGVVRRWDLDAIPATVLSESGPAEHIAASRDGAQLLAVDRSGQVRIWTIASGASRLLGVDPGRVTALAITRGGAITGDADGVLAFWGTPQAKRSLGGAVSAIAVTPDGAWVAAAATGRPLQLVRADGSALVELDATRMAAVAFDPRSRWLAAAGHDGAVRVWRLGDAPTLASILQGPTDDTRAIAFSPAGDLLAAAGDDGHLRLWTLREEGVDAASLRVIATQPGGITTLAFDPTGRWLMAAGRSHRLARCSLSGAVACDFADGASAGAVAVAPTGDGAQVTPQHLLESWAPRERAPSVVAEGALAATLVPGPEPRLAAALADGSIVLVSARPPSFAALRAALSAF